MQGSDIIATTETWWDSLHDWNAVLDDYVLFRKERPTRQGVRVALYKQSECTEFISVGDENCVDSFWVRVMGHVNTGDTVVCVYYRPPR